jgi:uncharacterized membrane protein
MEVSIMTEEPTAPETTETPPEPIYDEGVDVTSDDKLWAAISYIIPLFAIIALLLEDKKERQFIKYHAVQAIAFNLVLYIIFFILGLTLVGSVCIPFLWLIVFWPAYESYQGKYIEFPVITDFIKNQGWV